jgi:hypothetical protein
MALKRNGIDLSKFSFNEYFYFHKKIKIFKQINFSKLPIDGFLLEPKAQIGTSKHEVKIDWLS